MAKRSSDGRRTLLLYDIDGTILRLRGRRSREIIVELFDELFGIALDRSLLPTFSGKTDLKILREASNLAGLDFDKVAAKSQKIWESMLDKFKQYCSKETVELLPGMYDMIRNTSEDSRYETALLTGNFRENAYLKLSVHDLDGFFPFGAFGSDLENRNMLPALAARRACDHFDTDEFDLSNAVIIGDSPADVECSSANNLPLLFTETGGYKSTELLNHPRAVCLENFSDYGEVSKALTELSQNGIMK